VKIAASSHSSSASAPSVLAVSLSSDLIDCDALKAKELLQIAAKKTENFDEEGEYQGHVDGRKREREDEDDGELNDPVTTSMFARRSTPNLGKLEVVVYMKVTDSFIQLKTTLSKKKMYLSRFHVFLDLL
jgi:hypothetical protein